MGLYIVSSKLFKMVDDVWEYQQVGSPRDWICFFIFVFAIHMDHILNIAKGTTDPRVEFC